MKPILGILGATGVGKSKTSLLVAKRFGCDIISADSMQIYRGMDIGTAKLPVEEREGIVHHLIDVVNPDQPFSSWDFAQLANSIINANQENLPLLCGGTGFYVDSLLKPLDFRVDEKTLDLRAEMQRLFESDGVDPLLERLKKIDEPTFLTIDKSNVKRVIRAIEIASFGEKKSEGQRDKKDAIFASTLVILTRERASLVEKIHQRVDEMFEQGLVGEVENLFEKYPDSNLQSFQAIGYKEIIAHLKGECSLNEAREQIKTATRQYSKRQNTYFRRMNATWIDVENKTQEQIADEICLLYEKNNAL